jgi:hypothetical protein
MRRAIAGIFAALVVLTGCGRGERQTVPVGDLVAAVEQTRGAPSQRMHMDIQINAIARELHMTGTGVFDNRRREGRMTLDMSDLADVAGDKFGPEADTADQLMIGYTAWMRWPPFAAQLGTDKEWVKFDLQKIGEQQGIDLQALSGAQGDPTQQLDQLRAASGGVEVVGEETVRGVETTHYKASVDLKRYPKLVPAADRNRVRRSVDRLIELTGGQSEIPTEVWIGHQTKRVHKMRTRTQVELPNGGGFDLDQTIELYDFGAPVGHVVPPPESETADLADLAAGAQTP